LGSDPEQDFSVWFQRDETGSLSVCSGTSDDEMCNFYIMYYMDSKHADPYMSCMKPGARALFQNIPAEANVPIAVSPVHMNAMMHMGHAPGTANPLVFNVASC